MENDSKNKKEIRFIEDLIDKPIPKVYGSMPPEEGKVVMPECIDKPIALVYGPDSSLVFQANENDKKDTKKTEDKVATKFKTFFSCIFGKAKKK